MNDTVYKFKRYEDSNLNYSGTYKHNAEAFGLWDTTIGVDELAILAEKLGSK